MKHAVAVGADCFTMIRHLVYEAQLRGQEVGHGWHHKGSGGVGLVASESAEMGQPTADNVETTHHQTKTPMPKNERK
jgi:hypothetical protein